MRGRLQPAGPLLCFSAHSRRTPLLCARPASARTLRGGRKHLRRRGGDTREEGCAWEDGAGARRPDSPAAALTEVQELLHGEWRRREARIEVHLARNAALRCRPGARGRVRGQAAGDAGDGAERPDALAAPQQPCQPHTEPRRRSRSSRRQPAALCRCLGATCRTWRAAGAGSCCQRRDHRPLTGATPRRRSPEETGAGGKGALATAPCVWAELREGGGGERKGDRFSALLGGAAETTRSKWPGSWHFGEIGR